LNGSPNGQPKATTQQVEHEIATRELEDHGSRDVDVSALQKATPPALRMQQLRLLRRASGDRPEGRGPGRIEFEDGARLIATR
jgi:hypothetical protein